MRQKQSSQIISCPECTFPLDKRPYDTYVCPKTEIEYKKSEGIPNLLPTKTGGSRYSANPAPIVIEAKESNGRGSISFDKQGIGCLIGDISEGKGREIWDHISKIIRLGLPKRCYLEDGRISKEGVHVISGLFIEILNRYYEKLPIESRSTLTGAVNQARYEAELQAMGDYPGNFELPTELFETLPREGRIVEIAMGNGANLKRLSKFGRYESKIGFDYSFGMVRAAKERQNGDGSFLAIADAHNLPITTNSMDLALMFNALDRLRDPEVALKEIRRIMHDKGVIVLGQCMPFQYDITIGDKTISSLPKERRIHSLEEAVSKIEGAKIVREMRGVEWHPVTVTQGTENLTVDVVIAKLR